MKPTLKICYALMFAAYVALFVWLARGPAKSNEPWLPSYCWGMGVFAAAMFLLAVGPWPYPWRKR